MSSNPSPTDDRVLREAVQFSSGSHRLSGTLFRPADDPIAVAVLHAATGVTHGYYAAFAEWLAANRRIASLTYDYRDFGASAVGSMRQSQATMADWGITDQTAARAELAARYPDKPLWVIGHSLGGLMLPFQTDLDGIARVITVASSPAHWSDHPWPYRALALSFWFGHGRLATRIAGYTPRKATGLGADLPRGVYDQWRRWCTSRDFYAGDIGSDLPRRTAPSLSAPIRVVSFSDDQLVTPTAAKRLAASYPDAESTTLVPLTPQQFGLKQIGHISGFARRNRAVWPEIIGD